MDESKKQDELTVAAEIYMLRCELCQAEETMHCLVADLKFSQTIGTLMVLACTWFILRALEV